MEPRWCRSNQPVGIRATQDRGKVLVTFAQRDFVDAQTLQSTLFCAAATYLPDGGPLTYRLLTVAVFAADKAVGDGFGLNGGENGVA